MCRMLGRDQSNAQTEGRMVLTHDYQKTRVSVHVKNIEKMTVKELFEFMITGQMSQTVMPFGDQFFFHIAMVADAGESAKLSDHIKRCTYEAIQKANARYTGGK